jgi:hypothetical protein
MSWWERIPMKTKHTWLLFVRLLVQCMTLGIAQEYVGYVARPQGGDGVADAHVGQEIPNDQNGAVGNVGVDQPNNAAPAGNPGPTRACCCSGGVNI